MNEHEHDKDNAACPCNWPIPLSPDKCTCPPADGYINQQRGWSKSPPADESDIGPWIDIALAAHKIDKPASEVEQIRIGYDEATNPNDCCVTGMRGNTVEFVVYGPAAIFIVEQSRIIDQKDARYDELLGNHYGLADWADRAKQLEAELDAAINEQKETEQENDGLISALCKTEADLAAERRAAESLAIRVIGKNRFDNSSCQAHPLELIEAEIERLKSKLAKAPHPATLEWFTDKAAALDAYQYWYEQELEND